jgi:hypothetical protein
VRPRYLDWRKVDEQQVIEAMWYTIETLLQDAETQRCGFCAINSLKGMSPKAFNRKFMPKMLESVQNRLPIRIGALAQHMGLPSTRASELAKNTS